MPRHRHESPVCAPGRTDAGGRGSGVVARGALDAVFAAEWARAVAIIARATGDVDLAEDAVQEAFSVAVTQWARHGEPANPAAWIVTVARNRALDVLRRRRRSDRAIAALAAMTPTFSTDTHDEDNTPIADERLSLIFACCHPAIVQEAQVALTLRLVCGLTTGQIASAFLVSETTMGQRLSRAKGKIRDAGIPIAVPAPEQFAPRRDAVLAVVYLVFNAGYSDLDRADLAGEALRLGRLLAGLLPDDGEVLGLLALMLLQESRRDARRDADGRIVLLADQDRTKWNRRAIADGMRALELAIAAGPAGPYRLQAAIAACHASARDATSTDWGTIVALYGHLAAQTTNPVVELNRAVAVSLSGDPLRALAMLDALGGELHTYHPFHVAVAQAQRAIGQLDRAADAYRAALALAATDDERRHIARELADLES